MRWVGVDRLGRGGQVDRCGWMGRYRWVGRCGQSGQMWMDGQVWTGGQVWAEWAGVDRWAGIDRWAGVERWTSVERWPGVEKAARCGLGRQLGAWRAGCRHPWRAVGGRLGAHAEPGAGQATQMHPGRRCCPRGDPAVCRGHTCYAKSLDGEGWWEPASPDPICPGRSSLASAQPQLWARAPAASRGLQDPALSPGPTWLNRAGQW